MNESDETAVRVEVKRVSPHWLTCGKLAGVFRGDSIRVDTFSVNEIRSMKHLQAVGSLYRKPGVAQLYDAREGVRDSLQERR